MNAPSPNKHLGTGSPITPVANTSTLNNHLVNALVKPGTAASS
jgi:hypothetical protein